MHQNQKCTSTNSQNQIKQEQYQLTLHNLVEYSHSVTWPQFPILKFKTNKTIQSELCLVSLRLTHTIAPVLCGLDQSSCLVVCLPEAEAKAGESYLQLCRRQPGRADLLRGRGDRGGRGGGPRVVGQYYRFTYLLRKARPSPSPITMASKADSHDLTLADAAPRVNMDQLQLVSHLCRNDRI